MRKLAYPNMHNIPFLSIPLTGPYAIGVKRPVIGSIPLADGRRLLITEGEYCLPWAERACRAHPNNIIGKASGTKSEVNDE